MSQPVFLSYARNASAAHARALAQRLGNLAFLDTDAIDDVDHSPQRLLDGVLGARIVVIFATKPYTERRFCKAEMRLALAAAGATASALLLALGEGGGALIH